MTVHVAYYRVSTHRQGKSGLGLQAQRKAVQDHLKDRVLAAEFTEIESGRRSERPQLLAALAACRIHRATLVIAKLDRLSRNVAFVSNLMEAGVEFEAVDFPHANRLTIHILAAVAEHEAKMISERTKAALASAKSRGRTLGGYRGRSGSPDDCRKALAARRLNALSRARDLQPTLSRYHSNGIISSRAIADALNQDGIAAPRGGLWSHSQVMRMMQTFAQTENA